MALHPDVVALRDNPTVKAQVDMAKTLASVFQDEDEEISHLDILDYMAQAGLALAPAETVSKDSNVSSLAYALALTIGVDVDDEDD